MTCIPASVLALTIILFLVDKIDLLLGVDLLGMGLLKIGLRLGMGFLLEIGLRKFLGWVLMRWL